MTVIVGSLLNMVTEQNEEMVFDGDGRPAYSKSGVRGYNISSPPSGSLPTSVTTYAVWSTVLGQILTELMPDGSKLSTSIYAGGAKIGTQGGTFTSGGMTYDSPAFETSDPVTGASAQYSYDPVHGAGFNTRNIEPLGQEINATDPVDYNGPPSQSLIVNSAGDPEWQCAMPWTWKFMPFHCQQKVIKSAGTTLPWEFETKTSIRRIVLFGVDAPANPYEPSSSGRDLALAYALKSTAKPNDGDGQCPKDANGGPKEPCESKDDPKEPIEHTIPDFADASTSPQQQTGIKAKLNEKDQKQYDKKRDEVRNRLKNISPTCFDFLTKAGLKVENILDAIDLQNAYDGEKSTITMGDAGYYSQNDLKNLTEKQRGAYLDNKMSGWIKRNGKAVTMLYPSGATTNLVMSSVAERSDVYFQIDYSNGLFGLGKGYRENTGLNQTTILHEALHSLTGLRDEALYKLLTGKNSDTPSADISKALRDNDCTQ